MKILGIDPGLDGAYVLVDERRNGTSEVLYVYDMPTVELTAGKRTVSARSLARGISLMGPIDMVAVESVHSMPKQGVASSFNFGRSVGVIDGVLAALERPVTYFTPQKWHSLVGYPAKAGKDWGRNRCMELWPFATHYFDMPKHDGRADAALIALAWAKTTKKEEAA